jgi:hypothetical protein
MIPPCDESSSETWGCGWGFLKPPLRCWSFPEPLPLPPGSSPPCAVLLVRCQDRLVVWCGSRRRPRCWSGGPGTAPLSGPGTRPEKPSLFDLWCLQRVAMRNPPLVNTSLQPVSPSSLSHAGVGRANPLLLRCVQSMRMHVWACVCLLCEGCACRLHAYLDVCLEMLRRVCFLVLCGKTG